LQFVLLDDATVVGKGHAVAFGWDEQLQALPGHRLGLDAGRGISGRLRSRPPTAVSALEIAVRAGGERHDRDRRQRPGTLAGLRTDEPDVLDVKRSRHPGGGSSNCPLTHARLDLVCG
jgi:hypothetical protein